MSKTPLCKGVTIFFIHMPVKGHLGYLQILTITNKSAVLSIESLHDLQLLLGSPLTLIVPRFAMVSQNSKTRKKLPGFMEKIKYRS